MLLESLDCTLMQPGQKRETWEAPGTSGRLFQVPYRRIDGSWVTLQSGLFRIIQGSRLRKRARHTSPSSNKLLRNFLRLKTQKSHIRQ